MWNLVALQPKPAGAGERPITNTALLYSVQGNVRMSVVTQWDASHHGFWGTATAGSDALRAALRRRLLADTGAALDEDVLDV